MPRRDGTNRRKHRQQKMQRRLRRADAAAAAVQVSTYEITEEPLADRHDGYRDIADVLDEDARELLHEQMLEQPAAALPKLERLIEQYPDVPVFLNWLANCYIGTGRQDKGLELIRENFERNPGYLFARLNFAEVCLRAHAPEVAEAVMEGKFDLKALRPDRNIFHLSEFIAMSSVAIEYRMQTGNPAAAEAILSAMKQIAPDHAATLAMTRRVEGWRSKKASGRKFPFSSGDATIDEDLLRPGE